MKSKTTIIKTIISIVIIVSIVLLIKNRLNNINGNTYVIQSETADEVSNIPYKIRIDTNNKQVYPDDIPYKTHFNIRTANFIIKTTTDSYSLRLSRFDESELLLKHKPLSKDKKYTTKEYIYHKIIE